MFKTVTDRKVSLKRLVALSSTGANAERFIGVQLGLCAENLSEQELMTMPKGMAVLALVEEQSAKTTDKVEKDTDRIALTRPGATLRYRIFGLNGEVILDDTLVEEVGTPRYVVAQGEPSLHWWVSLSLSPQQIGELACFVGSALRLTVNDPQGDLFAEPAAPAAPTAGSKRRGRPPKNGAVVTHTVQ